MFKSKADLSTPALAVTDAIKRHGPSLALDGACLELQAGGWTGLIGSNGAGKTTLMLAAAGLTRLDSGSVAVFGTPLHGPRPEQVGWVPQEIALYGQLTARENLNVFGRFNGLGGKTLADRLDWALGWIGLESRADDRVATFSGGMKRRLNIACAVLHRPRLVLLDEPTVGVDPQAREKIFVMLGSLRSEGAALLHSSHELGDVEQTCDRLVVMELGRTVASGTVEELVARTVGQGSTVRMKLAGVSGGLPGLRRDPAHSDFWTTSIGDVATELPRLLETIRQRGVHVDHLDISRPGLKELFVELTGKDLRE